MNNDDLYPQPQRWTEFDKREFPEQRWRIQGLVPVEGFCILAAPSGEKKTWIAMAIAKNVADGTDFLNNAEFKTTPSNVLYVDQEMPQTELQRRGRLLGLNKSSKAIWVLNHGVVNLNETLQVDQLLAFIEENEIGVVIVDTLRAIAGGLDENKAEEVRAFFNQFKELKDKGVSVIFLDHCRKPQQYEGKKPKKEQLFASQDKLASVEVLMMVKSESGSNDIFVYPLKNRSGLERKPFKVCMREDDNTLSLVYDGDIEDDLNKKEEAKDMILEVLGDGGQTTTELIVLAKAQRNIGEKNVREALKELVIDGAITEGRKGRANYYQLGAADQQNNTDRTNELPSDLFGSA
ncbi:TPA: hypothetical protein DIC39_03000 [Patescibacteria group bacterium]|nr:MAG: hypothetical protein A2047_03910 [Omnitrophica bacterium GWA2_41_15]HCU47999.1 hypothetical protein [Patescibacteria group bacterium]